ncbi:MAG: alanine:cation symporter family protein [Prevotellaceae bacterium]|jgi:AGCS family alanine or glycine:cation symporter|nr:alanine:cation symporter family protein [Prevotellaceae bacterium]
MEKIFESIGNWLWSFPMLLLLTGGGLFLLIYSGFIPFRYYRRGIGVLRGKYAPKGKSEVGQISSFEALSSTIASTVGLGSISGVAVAITMGGPGAIFWMWISALVGMGTKFFTASLAVMYRSKDSDGEHQGGPMYYMINGLGKKWKPLAILFSIGGLFGCLCLFQANQLTETVKSTVLDPMGVETGLLTRLICGVVICLITSIVVLGGIKRIGKVAAKLVPFMVILYFSAVVFILIRYFDNIPETFALIFRDAFTGNSVMGGAVGGLILIGIRRGAFCNEAGVGTAAMMHGASKNNEPIGEGLVAMIEPTIDTILICTLTALSVLVTGAWDTFANQEGVKGIEVTLTAFNMAMPGWGGYILLFAAIVFAFSTLFSYSYYGSKCANFLFGAKYVWYYRYFYLLTLVAAAVVSVSTVVAFIDIMYAIMAICTMTATLLLAPRVKKAAKEYFARVKKA